MSIPYAIAVEIVESHHHHGYTLQGLLKSFTGGSVPVSHERPQYEWGMNGASLIARDNRPLLNVPYGSIGVAAHEDGNWVYGVYSIRAIWGKLKVGQLTQLSLWESLQ